jgi:hypothetical protein
VQQQQQLVVVVVVVMMMYLPMMNRYRPVSLCYVLCVCVYYRNKIKGKGRYVGEILRLCELKKRQRKKRDTGW